MKKTAGPSVEAAERSYAAHRESYTERFSGQDGHASVDAWKREDTVDAWRHERMHKLLQPLLHGDPGARWLTVGDGRYGTDAHYILSHGGAALATDISDTLLSRAHEDGYIKEFQVENAESLSLSDQSVDYTLCKESFHHFPRPMLALYEMIRVSRKGVVLIEPCEEPTVESVPFLAKRMLKQMLIRTPIRQWLRTQDVSLLTGYEDLYEDVGNYVYKISRREVEKAAWGLSFPLVAFKGLHDCYIAGAEDAPATPGNSVFDRTVGHIRKAETATARGMNRCPFGILCACIFAEMPPEKLKERLMHSGYELVLPPLRKLATGQKAVHGS